MYFLHNLHYFAYFAFKNNSGGSSTTMSTSSSKSVGISKTVLIRLQRIGNIFNLYLVDGTEDVPFDSVDTTYTHSTHSTGSFNVTQQATLGSKASTWSGNNVTGTTSKFQGKLHQVRVYCGGNLDYQSASQVFSSRPIPLIMKNKI